MNLGKTACIALVLAFAACDCDDQLRKALSNDRGDERKMKVSADVPTGLAEAEPNDSPERATKIRIGRELRSVGGALASSTDVDWFELSAQNPENLEVVVQPETMVDVELTVAVDAGEPLAYDNGRRGDPERIPVLGVGERAQRIAVKGVAGSSGSYTISFKRRLAEAGLESEPNDTADAASRFSLPGEVQGFYDRRDDRDVYRLVGASQSPFALEIAPVAGVRQIARLYQSAALAEPAVTLQVDSELPQRIPNLALSPTAPLFLVVSPLGSVIPERPYRITVTPHPLMKDGSLELEPNDLTPMPVRLVRGEEPLKILGYIHSADDRDRFALTPPESVDEPPTEIGNDEATTDAASRLLLEPYARKRRPTAPFDAVLRWNDSASNFGLVWTTADGTQAEFRRETPEPMVRACGLSIGEGEPALEVRVERLGVGAKVGEPQYTLELTDLSGKGDWEAEPNNTTRAADAIVDVASGALASPDDVDVFAFEVLGEAGTDQTVTLAAHAPSTDLVMRVLDDQGALVANVDNATVGSREKLTVDLPSGLYFVELRWKTGELCVPYELSVRN